MGKKWDVLLADDDVDDQEILNEFLIRENPDLSIRFALNGKEALSWLDKTADEDLPRLIILDYKMPVLNGVETLRSLNHKPRYSAIQKVVWSTSVQHEHKNLCLEMGASLYFSKPANPSDLKKMAMILLDLLVTT